MAAMKAQWWKYPQFLGEGNWENYYKGTVTVTQFKALSKALQVEKEKSINEEGITYAKAENKSIR